MAYSFDRNKGFRSSEALPVDGYVCGICSEPKFEKWDDVQKKYVKVAKFAEANRTVVPFDIMEGDYTGYFEKKFAADEGNDNRKWKGVLILRHPSDSDKYDTNERRYNSYGAALEDSNPSFTFELENTAAVKNKLIGIVFREKEFVASNGSIGVYAEPYSTYPVDAIREGKFKIPKRATIGNTDAPSNNDFVAVKDEEVGELPF